MNKFKLDNKCLKNGVHLKKECTGYFHCFYTGFKKPDNPNFLNILKNTFNSENIELLELSKQKVISILLEDIPQVINLEKFENCILISVPRAKKLESYHKNQLKLKEAFAKVAALLNLTNGVDSLIRIIDTRTTHIKKEIPNFENNGELPYNHITIETCDIIKENIENKNIILLDDIYTKSVGIDEDCVQALYELGANKVVFYAIAYTKSKKI